VDVFRQKDETNAIYSVLIELLESVTFDIYELDRIAPCGKYQHFCNLFAPFISFMATFTVD